MATIAPVPQLCLISAVVYAAVFDKKLIVVLLSVMHSCSLVSIFWAAQINFFHALTLVNGITTSGMSMH